MRIDECTFIDWQLELLAQQGVKRVVLCVGHLGEQIVQHVATRRYGLAISVSFDGLEPIGTYGAIKNALPQLGFVFGVLYGDVYPLYSIKAMNEAFYNSDASALMAVHSPGQGNAHYELDGLITDFGQAGKWKYGDAGFSMFEAESFTRDRNYRDLGELCRELALTGFLEGVPVTEPVYEIGSVAGLTRFRDYVLCR